MAGTSPYRIDKVLQASVRVAVSRRVVCLSDDCGVGVPMGGPHGRSLAATLCPLSTPTLCSRTRAHIREPHAPRYGRRQAAGRKTKKDYDHLEAEEWAGLIPTSLRRAAVGYHRA